MNRLPDGAVVAGRFTLVRHLGEGGMGQVYEAIDAVDGGEVALKIVHRAVSADAKAISRFEREIAACRQLTHPNTVRFVDSCVLDGGELALAMELVRGVGFDQLLAEPRGPSRRRRDLAVVLDAARSLVEAHDRGIVHRDLKPGNIIAQPLADGGHRGRLLDFGLALFAAGEHAERLTTAGKVVGTPAYMAPEQVRGGAIGPWTDVWALGVMLHEAVAGVRPFRGADLGALLREILAASAPPLPDDLVPADVRRIATRCLSLVPARRPTADEVARALTPVVGATEASRWDAVTAADLDASSAAEAPAPAAERTTLAIAPGTVVSARYEVEALLAQGGNGAVYRARSRATGGQVAATTPRPSTACASRCAPSPSCLTPTPSGSTTAATPRAARSTS
jgi:serine/threonine-protein kinase